MVFVVGELFDSFADLQQKLSDYSEETFCHFYIKDSKKLSADEIVNPNLIYKHIVYSCIYGGQKPRFRGSGNRSVSSIRHGCTAAIYLRVIKDRTHLQVRSFVETHNHEITEELYRSAAQDKKLPWDLRSEVEELLLLGADKDRLCEYIRHVTHKTIDKKHLFNMYETALKQQREISRDRAIELIQKAYGVETEEEADPILQLLLDSSRTPRKRKQDSQEMANVQYTYINEQGESQEEVNEELQRLMGTLNNQDGDRIVIVQGDEQYEVIETGNNMEEYLEEDDRNNEVGRGTRVVVKQEINKDDEDAESSNSSARFIRIKDLSRTYSPAGGPRKRVNAKDRGHKFIQADGSIVYEPPAPKTRVVSQSSFAGELVDGEDLKMATLRMEQGKLTAETEVLKLKRNKVVRDISKLDLEKTKLFLEVDLLKQEKKYVTEKMNWLANDAQTKELKNEKLRLEIEKLKFEMNSLQPTET